MNADALIHAVQQTQGELSEEQKQEIRLYTFGRELAHMVDLPGWQVALEMLADYANNASATLISLAPGDARVPNAHAAASALTSLYKNFIRDVATAVESASKTPDLVRLAYSRLSPAPPEMSA